MKNIFKELNLTKLAKNEQLLQLAETTLLADTNFMSVYHQKAPQDPSDTNLHLMTYAATPGFMVKQYIAYKHRPAALASYVRVNHRFFDFISSADEINLPEHPEILAALLHHRPDWVANLQEKDGGLYLPDDSRVRLDGAVYYQILQAAGDLTAAVAILKTESAFWHVVQRVKAAGMFGDMNYRDNTLYLKGRAFDVDTWTYVGADLQKEQFNDIYME